MYITKVTEKGRATQMMPDMYGHRISKGELYLRGNYLKVARSKNILSKKFEILNYEVLIPLDEVFETFVEVADGFTMSCCSYLALKECAKWAFSLILVQYFYQILCHSTDCLSLFTPKDTVCLSVFWSLLTRFM